MKHRSSSALILLVCLVAGWSGGAYGQFTVSGQVTDESGRPLPFVVVTSRTANGFISAYSDLDGRFDFGERPHQTGHIIELQTRGYAPQMVRLDADMQPMTIILAPSDSLGAAGWSIGLVNGLHVRVAHADGTGINPLAMQVDVAYRVTIGWVAPSDCTRKGPSQVIMDGTNVKVAAASFSRRLDCGTDMREYEETFDVQMKQVGEGAIRVIGMYEDVLVPIHVHEVSPVGLTP